MPIEITPEIIAALQKIRDEEKFVEEQFYPGAPTEEIRLSCEKRVNNFLGDVMTALRSGATKEDLFTRSAQLIESFEDEDTEEREKVGDYIGEMMRTLGIDDWTDFV